MSRIKNVKMGRLKRDSRNSLMVVSIKNVEMGRLKRGSRNSLVVVSIGADVFRAINDSRIKNVRHEYS